MKTLKLQFVGVKGPVLPADEMTGDPETGIKVVDNDREIASRLLLFLQEDKKDIKDIYEKRLIKFFYDRYNE